MNTKVKAGIIGSAGYTGGEMLRLLLHHPQADILFAHSNSQAGKPVYAVHTDLLGDTEMRFSSSFEEFLPETEAIFLCVGHGEAKKFLEENEIPDHIKIIDLSQDFRLDSSFVYGLPELKKVSQSDRRVANPGCFATAIQLALLPLAKEQLLNNDIHVSATTGSTGAGQSLNATSHFSWRHGNISSYKAFTHQHLAEIGHSLKAMQSSYDASMHFIPYRGSFSRGILASAYTSTTLSLEEAKALFTRYYAQHPFVHVSEQPIDLKQVVNTNKCLLHLEKLGDILLVTSIIDNLLKGASGQAVQNMNLLFGLEETSGLKLKASAF